MLIATEIQRIQKRIIAQIKALINNKNYEPGDKLPSERMLAEKFEVTRSNIRDSIQTLEFYGLVKSIPQSGTFVADIGITALNGMIDDILNLPSPSFKELVEARIFLELKGVKLAALRRTEDDLIHLENALAAYSDKVIRGEDAVQEDLLFHLAIAKASGNPTLNLEFRLSAFQWEYMRLVMSDLHVVLRCPEIHLLMISSSHLSLKNPSSSRIGRAMLMSSLHSSEIAAWKLS